MGAHYKLNIARRDVSAFKNRLLERQLDKNDRSFLHFAEDDWSGWRINGCQQINRGGFTLGYKVDESDRSNFFEEACALIDAVPGRKHAIRLFRLAPGVHIGLHIDTGEYYLHRHWREIRKVHIPIITNPACRSYEDNDGVLTHYWPQEGEFWFLDGNERHAAFNYGDDYRWHLVVDIDPTPELFDLRMRGEPAGDVRPKGPFVKML